MLTHFSSIIDSWEAEQQKEFAKEITEIMKFFQKYRFTQID